MVGYLTVLPNVLWADRETCHVVLRRVKGTVSKANHHSRPQGVFKIHVGKISHTWDIRERCSLSLRNGQPEQ